VRELVKGACGEVRRRGRERRARHIVAAGAYLDEVRKFLRRNDSEPMVSEKFVARFDETRNCCHYAVRL
jgi:hypothetical protein